MRGSGQPDQSIALPWKTGILRCRAVFVSDRRTFLAATALTAASYARILGANDRVGLGFVGYGLMGKGHVATFQQFSDVAMVAMSDVHRGRLAEGNKAMGGEPAGYADFRQLLDDKNVDAVVDRHPGPLARAASP